MHARRRSLRKALASRKGLVAAIAAVSLVGAGAAFSVAAEAATTLFSASFEDGSTSGWSKSGGSWAITSDGSAVLTQSKVTTEPCRFFNGSTSWTDYSAQARVKALSFSSSSGLTGLVARSSSSTTFVRLAVLGSGRAELQQVDSGSVTVLGGASVSSVTGSWHTLALELTGGTARALVDGAQIASGSTSLTSGQIGLMTAGATSSFDDVVVTDGGSVTPTTSSTASTSSSASTSTSTSGTGSGSSGLVGWATQNGGTTGGSGGGTVDVSSASSFLSAISSSTTQTVRLTSNISLSGMNTVNSNKTIIGSGTGKTITGGGLNISGKSNIIIRNLNFTGWDDDAINIQSSSKNIWVDHCSFSNGYDGTVDIKRGSDFITVSWNRTYNHDKTMLLGHSDDNGSEDIGHLRVTYHHNWFDGTTQRHPRVRFGNPVHVFNNYYYNNSGYGVASTEGAGVLVEGNYFEGVSDPYHLGEAASGPGTLVARNNYFVNSGSGQAGGSVASIPYSYTVDTASSVKSIVTGGAGVGHLSL